jgi:hypothetical protein
MNDERIKAFSDEIAELKLRGARGNRERWLLVIGALAILAGVIAAIAGGVQASGTRDSADQIAAIATGSFVGIALIAAGTALFIRYSMARFLRFWLVRLVHEQRSETDRLIAAITAARQDTPPPPAPPAA